MPARTLSDLRTYVKTLVGENTTTADFFSDAAYYRFISDAYLECARLANCAETSTTINAVADQAAYNVTGFAAISHVDYDDKPLMPITADLLYALDADWEIREGGEPEYVILNHTAEMGYLETADTELRQFILYPKPAANGTAIIRVIGPAAPTAITTAADEPSCLPDWAHDMVAYEGAARVLEAFGDQRNEELAETYRGIRDWYVGMLEEWRGNKHNKMVLVKGQVLQRPLKVERETHVNATGRAGSGA